MKNAELWKSYDYYTGELTKFSRQLAFAGTAICWFFKTEDVTFPKPILISLVLIVSFFILDILQYFLGAHILRWWTQCEEKKMWEKKKKIDGEYHKPRWLDSPSFTLFNIKIVALFTAFVALSFEFIGRII